MSWKDQFPKDNRYFETENGILYCGDCLGIMKEFPEKSIDLVLTDPPYNIASNSKLTKKGNAVISTKDAWGNEFKDEWEDLEGYIKWVVKIFAKINMVLTVNASLIIFFDRAYTGIFVYLFEKELGLKFRNKIYFEKLNPLPHFRKNNYRSCVEEAIWFTNTKSGDYFINFISQEKMKQIFKGDIGQKETTHPTEKYHWMIEPLITRHSKQQHVVLDPFLGSGTTAVVCEKLNRRWIGIELEEKYCEIAKKRIIKAREWRETLLF